MLPRLLLFLAVLAASCRGAGPSSRHEFQAEIMGAPFRMVLHAAGRALAERASGAAFDRVRELDRVLSDWRADSELSALCRRAGQGPVAVSADLFRALEESQRWSAASGGAFDVTVGPLVELWRRSIRQEALPTVERLDQARSRVGAARLVLDPARRTAELLIPGMRLDLGAIGKGLAADEALRVLRDHGIQSALLDAGGNVGTLGAPPDRPAWRVAVDSGVGEEALIHLELRGESVATSGDASRFVVIDGVRYSHIIDPATGLGLTRRIAATVIAGDGAAADAAATALCVLGPERGIVWAEHEGLEARVVTVEADQVRVRTTPGWQRFVVRGDAERSPRGRERRDHGPWYSP